MIHVKMKLEEMEAGSAGLARGRDWMEGLARRKGG